MASRFCKKCKTLKFPIKKDAKINLKVKEKIPKKEKIGKGVVEDKNLYATYPNKCRKCGHVGAEVSDLGAQYSDEDNLFLIKCGKCGYVERIGDPM